MHDLRRAHEGLTQALRLPSKHFSGETWSTWSTRRRQSWSFKRATRICRASSATAASCCCRVSPASTRSTEPPYSKAWRIVNEAEGQLGCKLIERDGARGSTLTPAGERAIAVYEELQADINNIIATKADALIASIKE